jgi:hypothetical protein
VFLRFGPVSIGQKFVAFCEVAALVVTPLLIAVCLLVSIGSNSAAAVFGIVTILGQLLALLLQYIFRLLLVGLLSSI